MNKSTGSLVSMRIQGGRKIRGSVHCPLIHVHCIMKQLSCMLQEADRTL